jgi:hypothetical protein
MKQYDSIKNFDTSQLPIENIYVFDKLDGSNVRCEVDKKGKILQYGKRHGLLDDQTPYLIEAKDLIDTKYGPCFKDIMSKNKWEFATFYFEFCGKSSYCGRHFDEPHDVVLFDIDVYKKGVLPPNIFLEVTKGLDTAALLTVATLDLDLQAKVFNDQLPGITFEGVICKGPIDRKTKKPFMVKLKTKKWYDMLKEKFSEDEALELSRS